MILFHQYAVKIIFFTTALTNAELDSKFEALSRDHEAMNIASLKSQVRPTHTTLKDMNTSIDRLNAAIFEETI